MEERKLNQAKLDNGTITIYDACSKNKDSYPGWHYLGEGLIYAINYVLQSGNTKYHFFLKPLDKELFNNE